MHKFYTSIILIAVVFTFVFSANLTNADYKGVSDDTIYQTLQSKEIISSSSNFNPEAPCSRAEFYKMALESANVEIVKTASATPFKDVPQNSWFAPYIRKAIDLGIIEVSGTGQNFNPNEQISKAEALKVLLLANKINIPSKITKSDIKFNDVSRYSQVAKFTVAAANYGLFKNERMFAPNKHISRAEAAYLIYEFINKGDLQTEQPQTAQPTGVTIQIVPGTVVSIPTTETGKKFLNSEKFKILMDVLQKINTKFIEKNNVSIDGITYGAIKGMVEKLKDEYSTFQEPAKATSFNKSLTGEFDGIGISIEMLNGKVVIITPLKNTPAEAAGIKPGDIIDKIDDKSISEKTLDDVVNMIQGPTGSTVKITVIRNVEKIDFSIQRAHIKLSSVFYEAKPGQIAYIELINFTNNTPKEFEDAMDQAIKNNAKGFIIDLRNNPGGFLNAAISVLNHFIPSNLLSMNMELSDEIKIPYISKGPAELSQYPIYVLINKGSASASEIMAGAIREQSKGKLVGKPSFGKGTVQELINYDDGSALKLSIAKWLTPKGNWLTPTNPLKPDYEVDEGPSGTDTQLQKAIDLLNSNL